MKHYLDIDNLRETEIDLGNGIIRSRNDQAFEIGDHIQVTEKVDGANASISLNSQTGELEAFSRKYLLGATLTLGGFWNYANSLDKNIFSKDYIVFGEWLGIKNKIVYNKDAKGKWFVFDVYDRTTESYWEPNRVIEFCKEHGLEYVHLLYDGEFKGWDHVRSFLNSPHYGEVQEGVVVRNITKMLDENNRFPTWLKIVNETFKESKVKKEVDPEKEALKEKANTLAERIVTENRVFKMITKLRDEGIVGNELKPEDMKIIAKHLPKRIYEDCVKEEPEVIHAMGEYGGKAVSSITMKIARNIIVG